MILLPFEYPEDLDGWTTGAVTVLLNLLLQVANREIRGPRLTPHPGMPKLNDCRKLYLWTSTGDGGVRCVYRLHRAEAVEVIAVGERLNSAVYYTAGERLQRECYPMHYRVAP